jgi:hypothetical protein
MADTVFARASPSVTGRRLAVPLPVIKWALVVPQVHGVRAWAR